MSKKTAYIVSLKFAPGLKKEFLVLGENVGGKGFNVKYLLSAGYANLEGRSDGAEYFTKAEDIKGILLETLKLMDGKNLMQIFSDHPPVFLCFYNPHPLNPFIARLAKQKFPEVINALYLHDPYKVEKIPYGLLKAIYITFVEFIQGLTVKHMDHVISPSEYSSHLFKSKYPNFKGGNYIAPLLVPDQLISGNKERKYFSIVGGAHRATGHDTFVELVNHVAEKGFDYQFALISSSNISSLLKDLTADGQKVVKIINKKIITDSEINGVIKESHAVFRLDREVTQSGVVPVAYMNETPIIARDIIGLKQHITHGVNGYIAPFNCTPENLIDGMDFVKTKFGELSKNARKSYEDVWAEWNFDEYYAWLIKLLNS